MSHAAKSLALFALYMVSLGVILMVAPNPLLALLGLPPTEEVWVRVVGLVVVYLGIWDFQAARKDLAEFLLLSVYLRSSLILFLTTFVLLGFVGSVLIWFGVIDLAAALWTALALKFSPKKQVTD
jgi:hypothetical protein